MEFTPQITPEMMSRYVTRRGEDLTKVESALSSGDYETLLKIAHQIKGNAATFNFTDLERMALQMEKAAHEKNRTACEAAAAAFKTWVSAQVR